MNNERGSAWSESLHSNEQVGQTAPSAVEPASPVKPTCSLCVIWITFRVFFPPLGLKISSSKIDGKGDNGKAWLLARHNAYFLLNKMKENVYYKWMQSLPHSVLFLLYTSRTHTQTQTHSHTHKHTLSLSLSLSLSPLSPSRTHVTSHTCLKERSIKGGTKTIFTRHRISHAPLHLICFIIRILIF